MTDTDSLEEMARRALNGDRDGLDPLVLALQPAIYGLAVRMLWNREDAEDATQEILIRVVTRLSQFDARSSLKTWAYRIAVNYVLDVKKSPVERMRLTFDRFADDLADGLSAAGPPDAERSVLTAEVKIGCTLGMLQCLDRPHRSAYILGEIMELTGPEAAEALNVPATLFRKRLERAREAIYGFTRAHCGLVSAAALCQCNRRVNVAVGLGRVDPASPVFAAMAVSFDEARAMVRRVDEVRWAFEVHRTSPPRHPPIDAARRLIAVLERDVMKNRRART